MSLLTPEEQQWLSAGHITRITDHQEALIYPMGAERFLMSRLLKPGPDPYHYNIKADVIHKKILVIPGYGNSAFLFALTGAQLVSVYDRDPLTIAWMKAFKQYYHYRGKNEACASIGDLMMALTAWYPPTLILPSGKHWLLRMINPKALRRLYIFQMLALVQEALTLQLGDEFALDKAISFYCGEIQDVIKEHPTASFDTAFVPYLLGVKNGIESKEAIIAFVKQIMPLIAQGHLLVTPAKNSKEFRFSGQRHFATTEYNRIDAIPELQAYLSTVDPHWFDTQGLAVFANRAC